jgi:hypothetical protein
MYRKLKITAFEDSLIILNAIEASRQLSRVKKLILRAIYTRCLNCTASAIYNNNELYTIVFQKLTEMALLIIQKIVKSINTTKLRDLLPISAGSNDVKQNLNHYKTILSIIHLCSLESSHGRRGIPGLLLG